LLRKEIDLEKKISILLKKLKIEHGSNVLLHSNSAGIYQFSKNKKYLEIFIKKLIKRIGNNGTLVIPTYNYDFTKKVTFDKIKSPSQVGNLSNYLLRKYHSKRTSDPIFSHLIFGKLFKILSNCDNSEVFGDKSIFSKFLNYNFKIVCFCCPLNKMTFLHFIEKKMEVKYRFNKYFLGKIKLKNKSKLLKIKYYVGKRSIDYKLKNKNLLKLVKGKKFLSVNFGRFLCYSVDTKYLYNSLIKYLKKDKFFLIRK
jgi:aminoglycoside 3-N-acetyltransferase|tara:strand:- start:719 stop:1480 length:762 start_codon:yes stop_codon:yes gene_type:complete